MATIAAELRPRIAEGIVELSRSVAAGLIVLIGVALICVSPASAQESAASETAEPLLPSVVPDSGSGLADRQKSWEFRWDDHPSLHFGRNTHIDFRARMQADRRDSEAPLGDASSFDIARRRVGVEGRAAGVVDFQIEYEISSDDPWRDVYVDYRQFNGAQVQAGKFKLPFGLDENTSAINLDFVYRSRAATQLAPGRDRGVMVHGRTWNGGLRYELGLFDHDGRNARTNNPEHVFGDATEAGRVMVQPVQSAKSPLHDLQLGVAFTRSDVPEGISALRGQTALDASFFPAHLWVRGQRIRTGVEARWRPGPFSVKAEYIRVSTQRRGQSVEDTDLSPLVGTGWYLSGTWLVTGEKKSSGGDTPRRPILRGGFGAIELAARIEALAFGSSVNADDASTSPRADVVLGNTDRAATLGVNWYPCRGIKIQANLIRETFTDPNRGPLPSKPGFWSRVFRLQLAL